jgi:hypothetical protein
LYQHAFNPARPAEPGSPCAQILDRAQRASLPVGCLSEPAVLRGALEALTFRLDGSRAAANTIIRKRAVLHGALSYPAEARLLPDNPLDNFGWRVPHPTGGCSAGTRGGPLSESVYGRAWHAARALALGPDLAASGLARRPYDLRHAAVSLWLNAGGDPAQIAARAGNSVAVLLTIYTHCIHGHDDLLNQQIGHVLKPFSGPGPCPSVESQRCAPTARLRGSQRLRRPRDGHAVGRGRRPLYVRNFPARPADGPQITPTAGHPGSLSTNV